MHACGDARYRPRIRGSCRRRRLRLRRARRRLDGWIMALGLGVGGGDTWRTTAATCIRVLVVTAMLLDCPTTSELPSRSPIGGCYTMLEKYENYIAGLLICYHEAQIK
jgi:hypothetical protein